MARISDENLVWHAAGPLDAHTTQMAAELIAARKVIALQVALLELALSGAATPATVSKAALYRNGALHDYFSQFPVTP